MAATATINDAGTGRAGGATDLTATASENILTIGGLVVAVYARLSAAGSFGTGSDAGDLVPIDADVWTEVYRREGRGGQQGDQLYFALTSGTGALYYRATT